MTEAFILHRMGYASFRRSLIASVATNVISTLLGFVTILIKASFDIAEAFLQIGGFVLAPGYTKELDLSLVFRILLIGFLFCVMSEGGVLPLFQKEHSARTIWRMIIIANLFSYAIVFILYIGSYVYILAPS